MGIDAMTQDDALQGLLDKVLREAISLYGDPYAIGRHRTIFRDGDWVIKVPTLESGIRACLEELHTQGNGFAKTTQDELGKKAGIPVVRMEFVTHRGWSEKPDWTWSIDCGQVGYTKDGRLVAYDWERA